MATPCEGWLQNSKTGPIDPNEKLFVFGYSCKIFRDDEKSAYIDQGNHLIPWMGDKTLMIDRYDVRGYLHDLSQYEPTSNEYEDPISEEEKLCDEERYRSLRSDMSEEQLYQEEELKRLRAAIAGDGAYHEIAFSYDNAEDKYVEPEPPKVEEIEDEPYQMPEGLDVPKGMEVPFTMKIHAIIEKTAMFVSEQGGQMEIIIKMKQHANPQFAFMHLDNPLYPYYKHLVKQIKSAAYKPVEKEKVSRSEDEDDDDHYLHPSLMAGRQEPVPQFTVPNINFRRSSDDSYSVLVRNLQQHRAAEEAANSPTQNSPDSPTQSSSDLANTSMSVEAQVPPPPDIQPIIDKMAEYVVKNGEDFETIVKAKEDHRFDFLHSWHEHHSYYIHKRNSLRIELFGDGTSHRQSPVVIQESGPVLYSNTNSGPAQSQVKPKPKPPPMKPKMMKKKERDYLNSQDSQSSLPDFSSLRTQNEDSDSLGLDSIIENSLEAKKPLKCLKGPISFSLKADQPSEKTKLTPLLLGGDSEEENGDEEGSNENSMKKKSSNHDRYSPEPAKTNASETKSSKPNSEELEAKQAEERIRDRLLGTVRERLAQQRKEKQLVEEAQRREERLVKEKLRQLEQGRREKQLQAERKRKAELFLRMLKRKDAPLLPTTTKHPKRGKSSDSSEQSGEEEPISVFGEKLSSDPETFGPHEKPEEKEDPKKKKARRRSRSREQSSLKSSKHDRHRSRSPSRRHEKPKKEKQLPAAYALTSRSRSRSHSPRRYRPSFNSWHRRR